jgi:tRNA pseudouridine13 synthase
MSHDECVRQVANEFGVSKRDVGCAGRKDFHAVTTQNLSIYLRGKKPEVPNRIGNIEILSSSFHTNKLRLGHLLGNSFVIKIRDIDTEELSIVQQRLNMLVEFGMPNLFGTQRFGNYGNNHELGFALIKGDWNALVSTLLIGSERHHEFIKKGEYKQAFDSWPFGQPAERNVLEAIVAGKTNQQACKTISRQLQKLWVNALQSFLFNEVLQSRMEDATWNTLLIGDLAWKHDGGGRTFEVTQEDVQGDELQERVDGFSLSPSGPLWGSKMRLPSGDVLAKELAVRESHGFKVSHLELMRKYAEGVRRPLRVKVSHPKAICAKDEHGEFIELQFSLPAGSYATVAVEFCLTPSLCFEEISE